MFKTFIVWVWLCSSGYVVEDSHKHMGHKLYTFHMPDAKVAKYCYKAEIINYIKTKKWKYFTRQELKEELK
jgi:hypothetical protein